jgi:hypothetical protein
LGERFGDELALLVSEVGIVTHGFLLCELGGISQTLFLPSLDDGTDTLEKTCE